MLDFGFYNMDCMEGMKEFPDKYFELAIVDPPYGDGGVLGRTERDSENGSTGTAYKLPREMLPSRGGAQTHHKRIAKGSKSTELVEHGQRNSEKNHSVGCCAWERIF